MNTQTDTRSFKCIAFQAYGLWYIHTQTISVVLCHSHYHEFIIHKIRLVFKNLWPPKTIEIFGMEFREWLAINWTSNTFSCNVEIFSFDVECLKHCFVLRSLWHSPKIIATDNRNIFRFFFFFVSTTTRCKKCRQSEWFPYSEFGILRIKTLIDTLYNGIRLDGNYQSQDSFKFCIRLKNTLKVMCWLSSARDLISSIFLWTRIFFLHSDSFFISLQVVMNSMTTQHE